MLVSGCLIKSEKLHEHSLHIAALLVLHLTFTCLFLFVCIFVWMDTDSTDIFACVQVAVNEMARIAYGHTQHLINQRGPDQNGTSLLYIMLMILHSGREPSILYMSCRNSSVLSDS